jgi:microcystin-dependent protein
MGETYGEKTHLMTIAEMATHTHTQNSHSHSFGAAPAGGNVGACNGCSPFKNRLMVTGGGIGSSSVVATNQSTGGGQAFNVIQPSIVKLFVIKY